MVKQTNFERLGSGAHLYIVNVKTRKQAAIDPEKLYTGHTEAVLSSWYDKFTDKGDTTRKLLPTLQYLKSKK